MAGVRRRRPAAPAAALLALAVLCAYSFRGIPDFRLDASGDSLVLEHDEDVRYYRGMSGRYESGDFVVVTYSPPEGLFSPASLDRLKLIRADLQKMERVSSVVTILDVPLLRNPPGTLKDLKDNIKTLESPKADLNHAIKEFETSPIYQNLIVGKGLRSSAIQVNFKTEAEDQELVARRTALREKAYLGKITAADERELGEVEVKYRKYKDAVQERRHDDMAAVRNIMQKHGSKAILFLGGIPMIVDDIMSYISHDIVTFGFGMLAFVMLTLYLIYGRVRWVLLPTVTCVIAVMVMVGGMGLFNWDVTVVSSNFVSLQLILTMSLSIHLVSHYRELLREEPDLTNHDLVFKTARHTFIPCLYTSLTTIAGFASLVYCDILPVVQFGWIMTMGLIVSTILVYWVIPIGMILLPKLPPKEETEAGGGVTHFFAGLSDRRRPAIYAVSLAVTAATIAGISRLEVENSFIDYFRESTDIYQGMKFIDEELGGTTPLDVIVNLDSGKTAPAPAESASADKEFSEFGEFEEAAGDASKYWFTAQRLATIEKIHDYLDSLPETGKVLSLATMNKTALDLNSGRAFDDFSLALLFNSVSDQFKNILITPYVSLATNEARITTRIKDSLPGIRRDALIRRIRKDLVEKVGLRQDQFRVSGIMVLYNNMLQSLYTSQIKTIGSSVGALLVMFLVLFRSLKVATVALLPQFIASISVLGIMGLGGIPLDVMTITIVSIAVGIGVEDAIHYVYRFQYEIQKDRDYVATMYRCHATIGNAMYYTSLAVTAGFSILAFSNFVPTVLFGVLTGVAMVVACVSSQTLLPALIILTKPFGPGKTAESPKD